MIWFLDEQICPPTVWRHHRFLDHACRTPHHRFCEHTYIPNRRTSNLPTTTSVLCSRPLDVLPLLHHQTTSFFFFHNTPDIPYIPTKTPYSPTRYTPTHATYAFAHIPISHRSHHPHYAVRPHLTEVSNAKI